MDVTSVLNAENEKYSWDDSNTAILVTVMNEVLTDQFGCNVSTIRGKHWAEILQRFNESCDRPVALQKTLQNRFAFLKSRFTVLKQLQSLSGASPPGENPAGVALSSEQWRHLFSNGKSAKHAHYSFVQSGKSIPLYEQLA